MDTLEHIFPVIKKLENMPRAEMCSYIQYTGTAANPHRVLLIGVYSRKLEETKAREINWKAYEDSFGAVFRCFRFFDIEDKRLYNIQTHELFDFLDKAICLNAKINIIRQPCSITMLDGGRFTDLPVIDIDTGAIVKNDSFVLSYLCDKLPIIVDARGRYGCIKPKRVIQYRLEQRCSFYNI